MYRFYPEASRELKKKFKFCLHLQNSSEGEERWDAAVIASAIRERELAERKVERKSLEKEKISS